VPAYIHSRDRAMLADPAAGMSRDMMAAVEQLTGGGLRFAEPDDVVELGDNDTIELLGVPLTVRHTPGHTPGSMVFSLPAGADIPPVLFSGDLLFAGSIGRTDLPGGDSATMMRSLQTVLPTFSDDTVVLPGHGPQTTMATERRTNPFLTGQATL
jgi:glyoxylase-like metal-dependent hydrolase (beta-lactamase superfamily II)